MRLRVLYATGAFATLLAAASMAAPTDLRGILTAVVGFIMSIIVVLRGTSLDRRDRTPMLLMGAAGFLFILGASVRVALDAASGPNFPSAGEPILLLSYVLIFVALLLLAQLRRAGPDQDGLSDALVVGAGYAAVTWALWFAPYLRSADATMPARMVNIAFAVLSTAIVVACVRLIVGPGARTPSFYLLTTGVAFFVASDLAATVSSTGRSPDWVAQVPTYLGPWIYILFGGAVLHPSIVRLAQPPHEQTLRLTPSRRVEILGALLVPPVLLAVHSLTSVTVDLTALCVGWAVIAYLVIQRFTRLVNGHRRAEEVQQILRDANAALATSSSRHAMYRAALRAVLRLVDDSDGVRVSIVQVVDRNLRVLDAMGTRAERAIGVSVPMATLPSEFRDAFLEHRSVAFTDAAPMDLSTTPGLGTRAVLCITFASQSTLDGALLLTTERPLTPERRHNVETLASTVSLALESAALTENLLRRRTERRFRALVEHSSDVVLVVDRDLHITFASPATHRLLGLAEANVLGGHPARLVHPEDWPTIARLLSGHDAAAPDQAADERQVEVQLAHVDGSYRWFEVRARDLANDPEIQGMVLTAREISDRKATERQLAESEARFRALVQSSSDIVAVVDDDGCFTYVSPAVTEILGFTPEELAGGPAMALMQPADVADFRIAYPDLTTRHLPDDDLSNRTLEIRIPHRSGEHRTLEITVTDMRLEPSVGGVVLNARDVTVRRALEADLRFQALHDSLTGLANRTRFTQQTGLALHRTDAIGTVGALFIDLDDFKTVNDSLGHAVGDQLLQKMASRLVTSLPVGDIAARLGGDEFAVLVADAPSEESVLAFAERLLEMVAQPFHIQGREIRVTASIGIAFANDESVDAEVLLRNADVAMYLAKDGGKGRYEVFEAHMHASVFERLELKADLARAIDDNQLRCFYQPIVSLQTGRITGVEALVRWVHPTRGLMSPDEFIPLAEESGLIVPLGRWVLREACQQLRTWQLRLPSAASLTMSINLSVRQLVHDTIVDDVRAAVTDTGVDPSTVTLEITETTLMHDTDLTRRRLAQLREIGVSLAVDDFGTGYSSLQYVQRFPIDVIKIDRSFIVGLGTNPGDGAVVQSMIELAQRLGVHTVAEGIDRPEQVTLLQSLGADLGQGFLFSQPLPAPAFDRLLDASPHDAPRVQLH